MNKISQYELVEILIQQGSTGTKFFFLDQPKLRNTALFGIECFSVTNVPVAPSQNPVINETIFSKAYLVLVDADSNQERGYQIPLVSLRRAHSTEAASTTQFVTNLQGFSGMNVNYSKSYIILGNATGISGAQNESFLFGITYDARPASENKPAASGSGVRRR